MVKLSLRKDAGMKVIWRAAEVAALITLFVTLVGCGLSAGIELNFQEASDMGDGKYFSSAKEAVTKIEELLLSENWPELARYYDLSGSSVKLVELEDGSYFKCNDDPDVPMHPALRGRCQRPFSPSFSYRYSESVPDGVRVHLGISIDQGGGMVQEGRDSFRLYGSKEGFRLRPDDSVDDTPNETPDFIKPE